MLTQARGSLPLQETSCSLPFRPLWKPQAAPCLSLHSQLHTHRLISRTFPAKSFWLSGGYLAWLVLFLTKASAQDSFLMFAPKTGPPSHFTPNL